MRRGTVLCGAAALLVSLRVAAPSTPAPAAAVQSSDGAVVWIPEGAAAARVEIRGAPAGTVAMPPGARIAAVARLGSGWIAAGSRALESRGELLILAQRGAQVGQVAAPAGRQGQLRTDPVLLTEGARLAGLAWLEGSDQGSLAVRAAAWDGAGWGPVQEVAEPGPGSQLALAGAVLADGSWLLVWSAFDGTDDEILWARRRQETWTLARRIGEDNSVPDITPAVLAAGSGALAAWSRFDSGHYRLVVCRFDGARWGPPRAAAPPGSLYPSFLRTGSEALLLYRSAAPPSWSLLALDTEGRPQRRAWALSAADERPTVLLEGEGAPSLRWPWRGEETRVDWSPVP